MAAVEKNLKSLFKVTKTALHIDAYFDSIDSAERLLNIHRECHGESAKSVNLNGLRLLKQLRDWTCYT